MMKVFVFSMYDESKIGFENEKSRNSFRILNGIKSKIGLYNYLSLNNLSNSFE